MKTFNSFIMGGYECADHINRSGERINLLSETQHDLRVEEDYEMLSSIGIKVVREGICWSAVECEAGKYNFTEVLNRMQAAEKYGIQQIWDLIHFGYPDGLYPTHPLFCERFERLCIAFATFYEVHSKQQLFVVPINEISFLSWHSGDVRGTVPFAVNSGWDIKYHLCKAAILGIMALKNKLPDCRILLVEPLVKIHPGLEQRELCMNEHNENQFQAMDIIAGRICPELGGREDYLDILGFNYYWNCQWTIGGEALAWPDLEGNRHHLRILLQEVYNRYCKPMIISETGHFGSGRVEWLDEIIDECREVIAANIPLIGMCIYPVTDRPDWDNLNAYSQCGIWDLDALGNRIPHQAYVDALQEYAIELSNEPVYNEIEIS